MSTVVAAPAAGGYSQLPSGEMMAQPSAETMAQAKKLEQVSFAIVTLRIIER